MPKKRPRHADQAIERALQYAEGLGWRVKLTKKGHAWGRLYCPFSSRSGCIVSIWSTPRSADNHARHIRNRVDACPHRSEEDDEGFEEFAP